MAAKLQLNVTGMTCGGCENAVTRAVRQMAGVEDVTASHTNQAVDVTFDEGRVSPAMIRERIESLGYEVIR